MSLTGRRIAGVVGLAASGLPGQPRAPAPERPAPGVYALARVGGRSVPAVLVAPYERPPAEVRERVLAGWLVLRPGGRFVTSLCIDQVDSAGRVVGERDGDMHSRFWQSGGRVYYQVVVVDGPQDSAVARVRGDTLAFDDAVWVRVRGARLPRNEGWGWMDACPAARAQPRRRPRRRPTATRTAPTAGPSP
jgi:hypothetical protein